MKERLYETVERAVAENGGKLSAGDMEFLGRFLRCDEREPFKRVVDCAFWSDGRGNLYRAWIEQNPFSGEWRVSGTQNLDWSSWGRTAMIAKGNRYKPAADVHGTIEAPAKPVSG